MPRFPKAGAKVLLFFRLPKFFEEKWRFFAQNMIFVKWG